MLAIPFYYWAFLVQYQQYVLDVDARITATDSTHEGEHGGYDSEKVDEPYSTSDVC